jgi:ubiquinone/menaquinone biosynthesis C-methylase UbiE
LTRIGFRGPVLKLRLSLACLIVRSQQLCLESSDRRRALSEADWVFAGSIPENYDHYLVPLIFEGFAEDLAQRGALLSPSAVLETAAGSGVVTRSLTPRLSPDASYIVTDLNQPMLDYAAMRQIVSVP